MRPPPIVVRVAICSVMIVALAVPCRASRVVLNDGRVLEGRLAPVAGTVEDPRQIAAEGAFDNRPVVLVDDGLRRIFVSKRQIREINESDAGEPTEKFRIPQRIAIAGSRVVGAGAILRATPFDEFGRRIVEMATLGGPVSVVQGITEITPVWTKVEAVEVQGKNFIWDMRIATSSIPRDVLARVLHRVVDSKNINQRLKIVRLYLQSDRYRDAEEELKQILEDFPEEKGEFSATVVRLHQAYARRILAEIRTRQSAGQHRLAMSMLEKFPTEDVAGETLQAVKQMLTEYNRQFERGKRVVERFDALVAELSETEYRQQLEPIRQEIVTQLSFNTLDRLAAFEQLCDADTLKADEKVALAVSGWLCGSNDSTRNLPVAISLFTVRNLVRQYLATPIKVDREPILQALRAQEGAVPELVAKILAHMAPPMTNDLQPTKIAGMFEIQIDGAEGEPPIRYLVQLPPEYDPLRRYPTIVTLHGVLTNPEQQIDWWAGEADDEGNRVGHAGRNGYILVAPAWVKEHQSTYNYSAAEHAIVLNSLRDACRRFAIDTDRVFLSGHSIGGDAAWDLGVAHPDLWAGLIPICGVADKVVSHYWENASHVPMYLVGGQLDGDKVRRNSSNVDKYLRRGYNVQVVDYMGRGHEHFSDEILNLFDWMGRYRRDFYPRSFECRTIRPWDNYFWWVELQDLPPRSVIDPASWPPPRNTQAVQTEASIMPNNGLYVKSGAGRVTLWLSPDTVDFERPATIRAVSRELRGNAAFIEPSLLVMLEDARTRADRQHPFWAKVDMPEGHINEID